MKKFKFSLQSLLDLRSKKLEEKQIELGRLKFVMKTLENKLISLENELVKSKENLDSLLVSSKIDISLINANQNYILKIKNDISVQIEIIKQHSIKLEEKKQETIVAHKEKTMLEKLKEKQFNSFLKEVNMHERKELDEIGLMRYSK